MRSLPALLLAALAFAGTAHAYDKEKPRDIAYPESPAAPRFQTAQQAQDIVVPGPQLSRRDRYEVGEPGVAVLRRTTLGRILKAIGAGEPRSY